MAGTLLDADMRTLGAMIARGGRWWVTELRALLPQRWRERGAATAKRVDYVPPDGFVEARGGGRSGRARRLALVLPDDHCLRRTLTVPPMGERDFAAMLTFEQDRIMPLPREAIIVAGRIIATDATARQMEVVIAGLPRARAHDLARAIADAGLAPASILSTGREGDVDLAPALVDAGILSRRGSGALNWRIALVALLALNLALLIWRDAAATDRLQALVDAQQPAVDASHRIARRLDQADRTVRAVVAFRRAHEPLSLLARVSAVMPGDAWVQRLTWQGGELKLAGYRGKTTDVAAALRRAGGLVNVRYADTAAAAADANGQPFEVLADVRAR